MKKIMILVATVAMATMANAASVGWTIAGAASYAGGDYGVYVIGQNGVTSVDQIVALVTAGTDTASYQFASGTVANNGSAVVGPTASGKSITYSGSGTDSYSAFAIIWNDEGTGGAFTSTATITMDNDSTSKTFGFGNQANNLAANTFKVTTTEPETPGTGDVPEPTSGLLLVLGAAGLALRRRRA